MQCLKISDLRCPPVDEANFEILMQYAKENNFGLSL